ncbi:MAG TPA: hypothetical protein VLG16_04410 [Candidatus Saccharimonadales bacterium]|nr:hypothetical protein [Candidatus Saccharimonadales bacterium]
MNNMFANDVENYMQKWQKLVAGTAAASTFQGYKPTAIGWKVEDLKEFNQMCETLRDQSEQVHYGWVNERWLATFYLREPLPNNVRLVKIMQRRPGSQDAVGLDHVDFLVPSLEDVRQLLQKENLKFNDEQNGICKWVSIWFDDTEAKLRTKTVLQVCAEEMLDYQQKIIGPSK